MQLKNTVVLVLFFLLNACSNKFDGENGVETIYYPNTTIVHKSIEYKDGKKNGVMKEFYKAGNIRLQIYYVNDEIRDSTITYFSNGKLAGIKIVIKKKKEGCWQDFNKEGKLYSSTCYKNGLPDGLSVTYTYRTGRLLKRFNYKDGIKHGRQEEYYNSGKPKNITYYNNGTPCIGTEEYDEGGKIDHDFKISIEEQNRVLMSNSLKFIIRLENFQEDDMVYWVSNKDTGRVVTQVSGLLRKNNYFFMDFPIQRGGFIMEKIKLAAYRKTKRGNVLIKTTSFNASANNY